MDSGAEAVFAANQAIGRLLQVLGLRADAMVGHSTGEHSALLVSGAVKPVDDADLIAHIRRVNSVFEKLNAAGDIPQGFLVAVGGVAPAALRAMVDKSDGRVHIAMDNCPHQTVLCSSGEYVETLTKELQAQRCDSSDPAVCPGVSHSLVRGVLRADARLFQRRHVRANGGSAVFVRLCGTVPGRHGRET